MDMCAKQAEIEAAVAVAGADAEMSKRKNEFIRFGKRKNEFIRFGKRSAPVEEAVEEVVGGQCHTGNLYVSSNFTGAEKRKNEFIRFGKRKNEFIRFGKRSTMQKRKNEFIRFG